MRAPKVYGAPRYRSVDEARIIEALVSEGWRYDVAEGRRVQAEKAARATLDRCVELGLPHRLSPDGGRLFDPAEASNFVKWAYATGADRTWGDQFLPVARRQIWEPFGSNPDGYTAPPELGALGAQRYAVTIRRIFNLADRERGTRQRLRLPLPLEDDFQRNIQFEFLPPPRGAVETTIGPGYLDAVVAAPDDDEVCVAIRASFMASPVVRGPAASLDPTERALYTRPSEGLIKVSPRVGALAAELAGHAQDPLAIMRRFWAFMLDDLASGFVQYDALDPTAPVDGVLERGWYDCKAGAALLVALCRARQIPARLVTGYVLCVASPGFHTWMEAWIEGQGWLPFDLSCWSLSDAGRDGDWRDYYFGRLDHRMVVERLPRLFSGLGSVRLPQVWRMMINLAEPGSEVVFENVETNALIYREQIEVARL